MFEGLEQPNFKDIAPSLDLIIDLEHFHLHFLSFSCLTYFYLSNSRVYHFVDNLFIRIAYPSTSHFPVFFSQTPLVAISSWHNGSGAINKVK